MARKAARAGDNRGRPVGVLEVVLLALCLCILALRATYTEGPTAQTSILPGMVADTVYSLTLSGLLIFAFVLWLVWRVIVGGLAYRVTGMEPGLALFGLAAVLSTCTASDTRTAITQVMMLAGPILAALLLAQILDSPARVRLVLAVIVALGVVSAYQCADQFLVTNAATIEQYEKSPETLLGPLGIVPGTFQHFLFEHRLYSRGIRGYFTTSNSAASFAIMASFAAAALFLQRMRDVRSRAQTPRYGLFAFLAAGIVVLGLFLTQSKGGILAFLIGLLLFGLLVAIERAFGAYRRRILMVALPLVLVLALAAGIAVVLYGLRHDRLPGGNSMLVRWQYWVASARMYADHPLLGVGPGNFSFYYSHYKAPAALEAVADPHNFLLSLAAQYGPLGLLGFLAMVAVPLWRLLAPRVAGPSGGEGQPSRFRTLALGMLLAICLCLVLVRPLLIPTTGADSFDVMLYEVIALYIAPVAAFLIGFLLIAAPFEDCPGREGKVLSAALGSAVIAVLLHNLIDFAIFEPGVWMTFWTLIACLAATHFRWEGGRRVSMKGGSHVKLSAIVLAFALAAIYGWYVWRPVYTTALSIHSAQRLAMAGRFEMAMRLLDRAERSDPLSSVPPSIQGRLLVQQYEEASEKRPALLEEAARAFHLAAQRNPADYKNYEKLALVNSRMGRYEQAYEWYAKATDHYPGSERLWFELAQTAERLDRPEAALDQYRKAVQIEECYREQFRRMYPGRETIVSRLGEPEYRLARERIAALSAKDGH